MSLLDFLPIAVTVIGGFLLIKLRAFFVFHPRAVVRELKGALNTNGAVRSLCLALAGTLGVGNIIGVAVGLIVGGSGSIFWLAVSSLFALVLKYSEACISSDISGGDGGGMLLPLKRSFARFGTPLSYAYAFLSLVLAFFMGGALQSVGAVGALSASTGINIQYLSLIFALSSGVILLFLKRSLKSLTVVIIPLITSIYIALTLGVVMINFAKLPEIISQIFKSALDFKAMSGGAFGCVATLSVREGFSRGLLSNEAGAGTSSFAHSEIPTTPTESGILGMCEVLFDTVILCPLTGIAILSVVQNPSDFKIGADLVVAAFRLSLGSPFACIVSVCILLFAFSTVVCWFYYGRVCAEYLHLSVIPYTVIFLSFLFFGSIIGEGFIVYVCDTVLLFLTTLTGAVLIKNSDRIKRLSELSGLL